MASRPIPVKTGGAPSAGGRVRTARLRAGLTQAGLASRADVSRQLVSAVEAGRHLPAVDAALRLARALGSSVEELFAPAAPAGFESLFGEPFPHGSFVRVGSVADVLVAAPTGAVGAPGSWGAIDAVIDGGTLRLLPGADPGGAIVVGCDPALGVAEALLASAGPRRLVAVSASSGRALAALAAGRCHAALVHGEPGRLPEDPCPLHRWHVARWRVGVAIHPSLTVTLADVLSGSIEVVQRDGGAASQRAFERARRRAGGSSPSRGPIALGHLEAAHEALSRRCAAVSIEPAALALGLRFEPLELHAVELWVAEPWVAHPGVRALVDVLGSPAFRERVGLLGGYDLDRCGQARDAA